MAKLTKKDIISFLKTEAGLSESQAHKVTTGIAEYIVSHVSAGDTITYTGLGTFSAVQGAERTTRNPKTKEPMTVPAKTRPKFKAGKTFKDTVSAGK